MSEVAKKNYWENKRVFITGSSRGLGNVFARAFAQTGATVIIHGRDKNRLEKALSQLKTLGYSVYAKDFDVTDYKLVNRAVSEIEKHIGPIDVLVNNAGINIRNDFLNVELEQWNQVMRTNLDSVFYVGQAVAKHMATRKKGKIVNICSLLSEVAREGIPAYTASKGGVKMLTKAMAVDLARYNIQVNGIGPGYFATEMNQALVENREFDSWIKQRTPAGRWGNEEELSETVLFLAGGGSSYLTGQIVYVDGGILSTL